ncbi:carbohydrate kinase family protein [Paenibacillus sp. 1P07SE]|uniref:carbohydrate kinase family protein n=1 Tax=Paenibacillus sp. 1P07SE TaxID=3132209 RepID=UPI0039A462C7
MTKLVLPYPVIAAGHVCLDIIPAITGASFGLVPGKLVNVGEAMLSTGGSVPNTGLALHRLGVPVRLMGKVGGDAFGEAILTAIRQEHQGLADGMIVAPGEASSYSIVISPPGVDRMFLHCTGANDTFGADDVGSEELEAAGLFHYGYPPLMRRMYEKEGAELARLMQQAKAAGVTTSLDMAKPDPDGPSGQVNWRRLLEAVLPSVDLFLPSLEELLYMLRRSTYEDMVRSYGAEGLIDQVDGELLHGLAGELLAMGAAIAVIKLGEHGLYMRTTDSAARLAETGRYAPASPESWQSRELYAPCFQVAVAGTTGAGDCTIAGFLAAFILGCGPEDTIIGAVGTGACNVERQDAISGIPAWEDVRQRVVSGWRQHEPRLRLPDYKPDDKSGATIYRR